MKRILLVMFVLSMAGVSYADSYDDLVYKDIVYQEQIDLNNKKYKLSGSNNITIMFSNGRVYGSGGINRYSGSYEIKDGKIRFSVMGSTRMMGDRDIMAAEDKYLQSLSGELSISVSGDKLYIGDMEFQQLK